METLTLPDLLSYDDLAAQSLTRHGLGRLIESGEFERIAPGLFLRAGITDDTTTAWIAAAARSANATLCLLTALSLHELTDEIPARSNRYSAWDAPGHCIPCTHFVALLQH